MLGGLLTHRHPVLAFLYIKLPRRLRSRKEAVIPMKAGSHFSIGIILKQEWIPAFVRTTRKMKLKSKFSRSLGSWNRNKKMSSFAIFTRCG